MKRLSDHVQTGSIKELRKKLDSLIKKPLQIKSWIEDNVPRSDKSIAFTNFLSAISDSAALAKQSANKNISLLALATRNQYEINVRIRSIIEDSKELEKWLSELITDQIQIYEGVKELNADADMAFARKSLEVEISRLRKIAIKHSLPEVKSPESTGRLASKLGLGAEHKSLFKLFSKLIHPTSYLLNNPEDASSSNNFMILQIHTQLYAIDSIGRICTEFNVPHEVSKPFGCPK